MVFIKLGESLSFDHSTNILSAKEALGDKNIALSFIKMAKKLKRVAPKAEDFLYVHCIMMHAAEASLIDQNTGKPILNATGSPVEGHFEKFVNADKQDSIKWISADNIKPYKNANGDSFPEEELLKAYKMWRSLPICRDHVSDSVEGIRGIIIDTHYDPKFKRVHALFALDRKNYGDLARKVETGYANSVSMGTGVGRSVCTDCHKVAFTEKDYCNCIRTRSNYGEINLDLSPIELSIVVNGADGLAKIRQVVASMNQYVQTKKDHISKLKASRCVNPTELQELSDSMADIQKRLAAITQIDKTADVNEANQDVIRAIVEAMKAATDPDVQRDLERQLNELVQSRGPEPVEDDFEPQPVQSTSGGGFKTTPDWAAATGVGVDPSQRYAADKTNRLLDRKVRNKEGGKQGAVLQEVRLLRSKITEMDKSLDKLKSIYPEDKHMNSARLKARAKARRAYWLGGGGVNDPAQLPYDKDGMADKVRDSKDKQMVGTPLETGSEGLHPGDKEVKEKLLRAEELKERQLKRRAYWQGGGGVNEPTPGKEKYPKEDSDSIRDKEDKQMVGDYDLGGTDGMVPGDEEAKKKLLRARLKATFTKVADRDGKVNRNASRWDVYAGENLILTASGSEIYGEELGEHWDFLKSADYGREVLRHIREEGFERTAYLLKGAAEPALPEVPGLDLDAELPAPAEPLTPAPELPEAEAPRG